MGRLFAAIAAVLFAVTSLTGPAQAADPVLTMSPELVDFAGQPLGVTSAAQTVTLTNSGPDPVGLSGFSLSGADAALFALQNDTCATSLAAAQSCTVDVTFTPSTAGQFSATLEVASDAPSPLPTVTLQGTGEDHSISMTPTDLTFGDQRVGVTTSAQIVTLTNNQTVARTVTVTVSGANATDFSATDTCTGPLSPGDSCTVDVTFTPSATGARTARLEVTTGDPLQPEQYVPLSGTGVEPVADVTPTTLPFGDQRVNTTSPGKTVEIRNTGTYPLDVTDLSLTGTGATAFTLTPDTPDCATPIPTGQNCRVTITFTPTAAGPVTATLNVTSDGSQNPLTVALSGTGVEPVTAVTPTTLPFGDQRVNTTSPGKTIEIRNTGTYPLTVSGVTVTGSSAFTVVPDCATPLAVGQKCSAVITFTPTAAGPVTATLNVTSDGSQNPLTVALSGTGVEPVTAVTPTTLPFGDQRVNTTSPGKTIEIRNTGTYPLTVSSVTVTGSSAFTVVPDCATPLAAGQKCSAVISFSPTAVTTVSASLRITSDGSSKPLTVPLTGRGVLPDLAFTPQALSFAGQQLDTTSSERTVTLRNSGSHPLKVGQVSIAGSGAAAFKLHGSTCDLVVSVGSTCVVQVVFAPRSTGPHSAMLTIANDSPGGTREIPLNGTGTLGQLTVQQTALDFGVLTVGGTSDRTVTVSNTGTSSFTLAGLTTTGPDSADFKSAADCPTVGAGESCTVTVRFTAKAEGDRLAVLRIITSVGTHTVSLNGSVRTIAAVRQAPLKRVRFAKGLKRNQWTPVMALPVRTNAGLYAAISVTPSRRVDVRQYRGKLEVFVRGARKAQISIRLRAPAVIGYMEYKKTKTYRVSAR